jgi:hypothetical protein
MIGHQLNVNLTVQESVFIYGLISLCFFLFNGSFMYSLHLLIIQNKNIYHQHRSVKFLAFERACEALFNTFPSLRETVATALGVSLVAGALSGALSSIVSQPADSILTYVAKNKGSDTSASVLEGGMLMVEKEGIGSLYRGLSSRCLWATLIISGQFFLYDIFRSVLGINAEDLTQVFRLLFSPDM